MFNEISVLRVSSLFCLLFLVACSAKDGRAAGLTDAATCANDCKGPHDVGCQTLREGVAACRCQAGYYSVPGQCDQECSENQYWSLFTYGQCSDVDASKEFDKNLGLCNKLCVFRVRLWATIFMIILFASAILLLILMLPGCITSCYTCVFLRKQKRRAEEDAAIAAVAGGGGDPQGMMMKPGGPAVGAGGAQPGGYNYPFYGWPYYAQGQGR